MSENTATVETPVKPPKHKATFKRPDGCGRPRKVEEKDPTKAALMALSPILGLSERQAAKLIHTSRQRIHDALTRTPEAFNATVKMELARNASILAAAAGEQALRKLPELNAFQSVLSTKIMGQMLIEQTAKEPGQPVVDIASLKQVHDQSAAIQAKLKALESGQPVQPSYTPTTRSDAPTIQPQSPVESSGFAGVSDTISHNQRCISSGVTPGVQDRSPRVGGAVPRPLTPLLPVSLSPKIPEKWTDWVGVGVSEAGVGVEVSVLLTSEMQWG